MPARRSWVSLGLIAQIGLFAPVPSAAQTGVFATVGSSLRMGLLDSRNGELGQLSALAELPAEIHYVAVHPSRRQLYVSVTDRAQANFIYAFSIAPQTGALSPLGERVPLPSTLSRAVHIAVDGTGAFLLMAHNVTETVGVLRLRGDGSLGELVEQPAIPKLGFLVHQIRIDPANRWVFVPVRGADATASAPEQPGRIHVFAFDAGALRLRHTVELESGTGPRHLDFHPSRPWVYVLTERGNEVITYRHEDGRLVELGRTGTLRDRSYRFPAQRAGAIHVHPNGRWLYSTNRNVAPCASSTPCVDRHAKPFGGGENNIALYVIDDETGVPRLTAHTDSRGFEPRTFTFDPEGRFLVVGNMMNIVRRDGGTSIDVQPNLSVFGIGSDGGLTHLRSYDQPGGGLLWWVGAHALR